MQQLPSSETMQIIQENDIFAVLKGKKKKGQHRIFDSLKKYPSKLKEKYFLSETEK